MIVGTGIDIVEVGRIRRLRERHGERFLSRVLLPAEVAYCLERKNVDEHLAARFAAKEAGMKALGTGWARGVGFHGLEVLREGGSAPRLLLHGAAADRARELGVARAHLSISHGREHAVAVVILET